MNDLSFWSAPNGKSKFSIYDIETDSVLSVSDYFENFLRLDVNKTHVQLNKRDAKKLAMAINEWLDKGMITGEFLNEV